MKNNNKQEETLKIFKAKQEEELKIFQAKQEEALKIFEAPEEKFSLLSREIAELQKMIIGFKNTVEANPY
jgi:hypothetical protein